KAVVVSGAASGIGRAVARHLAALGAQISLADINLEGVSAEAEQIRASGGICLAHRVDVRDRGEVDRWIRSTVDTLGHVDGAVNCAGVTSKSDEEWDAVLDTNLTGMFRCLRAQLAVMNSGGSVVNLTSTVGMQGLPFAAPYCVSKHGIIGLTKTAAKECANRQIRINAIAPATIDTPMLGPNTGRSREQMLAEIAGHTPMNRLGTVEEVAKTAAFLLSADSSFTTGAVYTVDGG
ncbi:short-chain dehydrogenase/reductase SDR, partial [Lentithecium fluviatile CBS 122367]